VIAVDIRSESIRNMGSLTAALPPADRIFADGFE